MELQFLLAALRTKGAAGPSGLDAYGWKHLCTSFQAASDDLCDGLALVAKCICTSFMDPAGITALVASRLIALDKSPGVRPIRVGEVIRRIISKAVLAIVKFHILEAVGSLQLCAGGNEAVIHAMREVFDDPTTRVSFRGGGGEHSPPLGFGLPPLGNFVLTVNQFKCFKSLLQ